MRLGTRDVRTIRRWIRRLCSAAGTAAALAACSDATGVDTRDRRALFHAIWSDFDARYVFFELGGIDWAALGQAYGDSVNAASSDREVARLIGGMVARLGDYHADVTTPFGTFGPPPIPYAHHFSPVLQTGYTGALHNTPSQRIRYGSIGDVGYVFVPSFAGQGWGGEIEQALAAMGTIAGLIIDIRDNSGGNEGNGRDIAARLYDVTRPYRISRFRDGPGHGDFGAPVTASLAPAGNRRFAGPVVLITNRFNGSSAEDFTLMLRVLPQVTVVGDTTLGVGSNPLVRTLGSGWSYRVPQSMQSTPDGFVYQWQGLPPDVPVEWSETDVGAGRDPYIEAALAQLGRQTP